MKIYSGKLVINIATVVEEKIKAFEVEEAHKELTDELFNEIRLLLGSHGFWANDIGATLEECEYAKDSTIKVIQSEVEKAKKVRNETYSNKKVTRTRIE
ncbi:hypothetical protein BpOF4_03650 [Alkalihalophilus pseudofirmus OF4]|uniref:Uncharacterized protein n=1 Tax=Alkalihalophilus pseudofirmus (strain ATCC BAA-2126 / JCM 17055 / OF4) TaxID=398511 RepID=D3FX41_ALKPO|nr:hypothetical protein [Alkalihalophilus pseudofirmus]ADC48796.1 hypothetical protein BpOF4_03650 [Alkalihalophilus pseudofirmus OF4]